MANHGHQQLNPHLAHQIHYLQLPPNLLPTTVAYQDVPVSQITLVAPTTSRSGHVNVPKSSGVMGGGGCVICSGTLPPRIARGGGKKPIEVFTKTCELLNVPVLEIQHEWEFAYGEKLPFCITCIEVVQPLIALQEQLEIIQKKLASGIEGIRDKIRQASTSYSSDLRTANFRLRALGGAGVPQTPTTSITQTTTKKSNLQGETSSSAVSDFSTIFTTPATGYHSSESGIQQDASRHQYPGTSASTGLNTYANLQPMGAGTPSQVVFHSVFGSQTQPTASVSSNADEYSNDGPKYFNENENDSGGGSDDYSQDAKLKMENSSSDSDEKPKKRVRATSSSRRGNGASGSTNTSRFTASRSMANKGRSNAEYFSPVTEDDKGRLVFEGITILPGKVGYACGLCGADCGKGLTTAAMRKVKIHIKGVHLKAYKCDICNKYFTSNDILSQHTVRAHEQADVPCDICLRPVRPRYLIHHKFTHMNAQEKAASIAAGFKPQAKDYEQMERRYICSTCGKAFKKRSVLQRHEMSHKDVSTRKDYKCNMCEKGYTTEQALRDHISLHHDPTNLRKAICKYCNKSMFPKYLRKHLKTHIAKEERPHVCRTCGRRLVNFRTLQIHEAAHDPGDTPELFKFECDICGQRFKNCKRMRQHRRKIHPNHWKLAVPSNMINEVSVDKPGEDDFIEDLNNEGLQEIGDGMFSYQLYEVKKLNDPCGYSCATCNKTFIGDSEDVEDQVKDHIRTEHIGLFRCNLCTKRMKNINEVIAHKRREHQNQLDFDCNICGRSGIPGASFKPHLWSHKNAFDIADAINSGEKVPSKHEKNLNKLQEIPAEYGVTFEFQCAVCQSTFSQLEDFYSHMLEQHPDTLTARVPRIPPEGRSKRGRKRILSLVPEDCEFCGKHFETGQKLNKHIRRVHRKQWKPSSSRYSAKQGKISPKSAAGNEAEDEMHNENQAESTIIKAEIVSGGSSESDNDASDDDYDGFGSDRSFDPEFKSPSKVKVLETSGITLRNRASLRPRREFSYNEDEDVSNNSRVNVNQLPASSDVGKHKVKNEHMIEYVTPDGVLTEVELFSENDIKRSPHSSGAEEEEGDWAGETEGEDEED
ncbi:putative zinc finger protein [Orchesella cincta]|uniref:Putative zinc finger protein n=1 Tax=Orchesella cincta TaxID=48709 RepID=A0A1D2N9X8_ORCCI|nr:putative zinc finger protein [Orchesella cincta]